MRKAPAVVTPGGPLVLRGFELNVYAVSSTGVYCRPSCPSRRPRRENVEFFGGPAEAEQAGYRACRRCAPKSSMAPAARTVQRACAYLDAHLDEPVTLAALGDALG